MNYELCPATAGFLECSTQQHQQRTSECASWRALRNVRLCRTDLTFPQQQRF